jgi:uncharacterized membrane protein (DUF485 family)
MSSPLEKAHEVIESPAFKELVKKRWTFSLSMSVLMLVVYFSFLISIAFNKQVFAIKVGSHLTLGILWGLGIIVFAWLMTGVYVYWANHSYDKTVEELKSKL